MADTILIQSKSNEKHAAQQTGITLSQHSSGQKATPSTEHLEHTPIRDYLERTTVRRETPIPGTAGRSGNSENFGSPRYGSNAARSQTGATAGQSNTSEAKARPKQKQDKLYDQNALAIQKSLAERAKAEKAALEQAQTSARMQAEGRAMSARTQTLKLVIALAITLVLGVALYFVMPEMTRIQKVTVNGRVAMTQEEIVAALGLTPQINLINADIPAMEQRVLANPKVQTVRISRAFPDGLVIDLAERKAVACVLVSDPSGTRPVGIDADGVAFADLDEIPGQHYVPVLSGIRFENYKPGQRLPQFLQPLLSDLAMLEEDSPSVLDAFSEIKIEKISDADVELVLYPKGKSVPVRMPSRLTKANLGSALLVLDILSGRPDAAAIQELDFRSGNIVYRTKEAQPG
ncbi:MAG TPA: FtsQ-type POTRA domain-containing protein [Spirochaetales bacterium]|nr:FtsQ-type POTRA domain-containing protein [Spirochaetales bacterium]